jgi:hypothetical protein
MCMPQFLPSLPSSHTFRQVDIKKTFIRRVAMHWPTFSYRLRSLKQNSPNITRFRGIHQPLMCLCFYLTVLKRLLFPLRVRGCTVKGMDVGTWP